MLRFTLELLPPLLIGLVLGWSHPGLPSRLARPLVSWGVPLSMVGLLLRSGFGPELLLSGVSAALLCGGGLLAVGRIGPLRRLVSHPGLRLGAVIGNTGYFGIPAAVALLPPRAVAHSIIYDLVGTLITWSLGPLLITGQPLKPGLMGRMLAGSPAARGLLVALAIQATPWGSAVADQLWLPARAVLLLALALVGMRLGVMLRSPEGAWIERQEALPLGAALVVKLLLLPVAALGLTAALGLGTPIREALVLQAAAPTAVSALLLAEAAGRDQERTAHLVLWSTLVALLSVPAWWWLLGRGAT